MAHLSVSCIVPTYNRAPLLDRALRSAIPQCEPGDEIIVIDDGSTDGTEALVREFGSPVRYLSTAHAGAGPARNAGVEAARGDLVAFLDSDDEWIPNKLSWQRAVLEQFPDLLFLFSDFGTISKTGARGRHGLEGWKAQGLRPWGSILGQGQPSETIPGLPASAPHFDLSIGRLYESYVWGWCVFTSTVIVRKAEAGDALHFAEDLPTYEDVECWARLAGRGLAGFMDCDTAWQRDHMRGRLVDADSLTNAQTAVKVTGRVWGADAAYLSLHRDEYESIMDAHRGRAVRYLLGRGRQREAREELAHFFHQPPSYRLLACVPGRLMGSVAGLRRSLHSWRGHRRR